jgi:hypothetical protein
MRKMLVTFAVILLALAAQAVEPGSDPTGSGGTDEQSCARLKQVSQSEVEQLYFALADLPLELQREQTWGLRSATLGALWSYNIEKYVRDHPALSPEAREILARGASLAASPGWFDLQVGSIGYDAKTNALEAFKTDAKAVLSREIYTEAFLRLGHGPMIPAENAAGAMLQRMKVGVNDVGDATPKCTCSGIWECGAGWMTTSVCSDSYCNTTLSHCGVFGNEACWGKCKQNVPNP